MLPWWTGRGRSLITGVYVVPVCILVLLIGCGLLCFQQPQPPQLPYYDQMHTVQGITSKQSH